MKMTEQTIASSPSAEARIQELLTAKRSEAYEVLERIMSEAFSQIGLTLSSLARNAPDEYAKLDSKKHIAGVSRTTLREIHSFFGEEDMAECLALGVIGDRIQLLKEFLDFKSMQMEDFRRRYPNAFKKWTEEEDATLLESYQEELEDTAREEGVDWDFLAFDLGRNVNAIKLRLEKLGVDLGSEAGRPRRQRVAVQ